MNDTHITLRLSSAINKIIEKLSHERGVAKSQIVREAVATYVRPSSVSARSQVTGVELAARWPTLPRLGESELADFESEIAAARSEIPVAKNRWK